MLVTDKRCWAEINLSVISKNYEIYKNHLPKGTKVMAVVKADAYGHGDTEIAGLLQNSGVTDFAVELWKRQSNFALVELRGRFLFLAILQFCRPRI